MSAETTTKIMYAFQVHFRDLHRGGVIGDALIYSESSAEAKATVEAWPEIFFVSIGKGRPIVDSSKSIFNLEEVAALFHVSEKSVMRAIQRGDLKPLGGVGSMPWLFSRKSLGLEEAA